jgi:ABC-2 type transport system ATP-binding protein
VRLEGVSKRLGRFQLEIPKLTLERGYVLGLIGRNGAGKTTTISLIMNLFYPDRGHIEVLGLDQPAAQIEIRRRIGYLSETPAYYEDMTVAGLARFVAGFYPRWDAGLHAGYLRHYELDPKKKVKQLSKGMKVKLGLLLALSHRPELLILDEPTSGLDPVARKELLTEISAVIADGQRTVVFSSHITQDVEQVADYVAVVHNGRIAEYDDRERLLDRWRRVSGWMTQGGKHARALKSVFTELRCEGSAFVGATGSYSEDLLAHLRSEGLQDLRVSRMGLDDILVSISGGSHGALRDSSQQPWLDVPTVSGEVPQQ